MREQGNSAQPALRSNGSGEPTDEAKISRRAGGSALIASRMQTALAHRNWSLGDQSAGPLDRHRCHAFFVTQGNATLAPDDHTPIELSGPSIIWLPSPSAGEFRLMAGSEGYNLAVADDFLSRTIGDSPLASLLRPLLGGVLILSSDKIASYLADLSASFEALARESRDQEPGASAIIGLNLGIVLVHLWRACGSDLGLGVSGSGTGTVQRFQQLVELHYRENFRIDRFARLLGVTRAHLHQACIGATGQTPLALIHDRIVEEAKLKLRETQIPVEQVGYSLGFRDPAYFNRFFKRLTSRSPAAFRRDGHTARPSSHPKSFADWP